jgi:hypothetical protein
MIDWPARAVAILTDPRPLMTLLDPSNPPSGFKGLTRARFALGDRAACAEALWGDGECSHHEHGLRDHGCVGQSGGSVVSSRLKAAKSASPPGIPKSRERSDWSMMARRLQLSTMSLRIRDRALVGEAAAPWSLGADMVRRTVALIAVGGPRLAHGSRAARQTNRGLQG